MDGKPVVRGTRIPVELVLRKLGAGMSPEAILADHPRLTHDDIHAAQAFAADYLADEDIRSYEQLGVDMMMSKPFDFEELQQAMAVLDKRPSVLAKAS